MKFLLFYLFCLINFITYSQPTYEWSLRIGASLSDYVQSIRIDEQENIFVYGYFSGTPLNPVTIGDLSIINAGMHLVKMDSNLNVIWCKFIASGYTNYSKSLAIDNLGNSYVIGVYLNNISFEGIQLFSSSFGGSSYILKIDDDGNFVWAKNIICSGGVQNRSIECDKMGNVIIGGDYQGYELNLEGTIINNIGHPATHLNDFIAKYNSNGDLFWAKNVGSIKTSACNFEITTDLDNSILVTTGIKNDTLIFANDTLTNPFQGSSAFLLAKFDSLGNEVWAKTGFAQELNSGAWGSCITTDFDNNIYVGGTYGGTINLTNQSSVGGNDVFVAKYDEEGNFKAIRTIQGAINEECNSIAVDSDKNVYLVGWFTGSEISIEDTILSNSNWSSSTIFFTKYDSLGNYDFIDVIGNDNTDQPRHISADINNNIYITGFFQSAYIEFGTNVLINDSMNTKDGFIVKVKNENSNTLGLNTLKKTDYTIFPNPVRNQFTIKIDNEINNAKLVINDIKGNKVFEKNNLFGFEINISTQELPDGMYFINLSEEGKTILNDRIISSGIY